MPMSTFFKPKVPTAPTPQASSATLLQETESDPPLVYGNKYRYVSKNRILGYSYITPKDKMLNLNNKFCYDENYFFNFGKNKYKIVFVSESIYTRIFLVKKYIPSSINTQNKYCSFISLGLYNSKSTLRHSHEIYQLATTLQENIKSLRIRITNGEASVKDLVDKVKTTVDKIIQKNLECKSKDNNFFDENALSAIKTSIDKQLSRFRNEDLIKKTWFMSWNDITSRIYNLLLDITYLKTAFMLGIDDSYSKLISVFLPIQNSYIQRMQKDPENPSFAYINFNKENHTDNMMINIMQLFKLTLRNIRYNSKTKTDLIDRTYEATKHFLTAIENDIKIATNSNTTTTSATTGGYMKTKDKIRTAKGTRCVYLNKKGKKFVKLNGRFVACGSLN